MLPLRLEQYTKRSEYDNADHVNIERLVSYRNDNSHPSDDGRPSESVTVLAQQWDQLHRAPTTIARSESLSEEMDEYSGGD